MSGILLLTFRELWAKKITLGLFVVSTLAWLLLASALNLDVVEGSIAGLRIFGQDATPTETVEDAEGELVAQALSLETFVVRVEGFVAGAAYWLAALLGLFATAPLLASMQERGRIDLLLSKPVGRTRLLAGHVLGVWLVVLLLTVYLLGSVWLVMSIKTGVWHARFLIAVVVVAGMFAVMYGVLVLVQVTTQSTALALILTYGLLFASVILQFKDQLAPQIGRPWRELFVGAYHVLPHFAETTGTVVALGGWEMTAGWTPFLSSLATGAVLYAVAFGWFARRDY